MKIRPSVGPMCSNCRRVKRRGRVGYICSNPKHKQMQPPLKKLSRTRKAKKF